MELKHSILRALKAKFEYVWFTLNIHLDSTVGGNGEGLYRRKVVVFSYMRVHSEKRLHRLSIRG